jgi:hypothetical protein
MSIHLTPTLSPLASDANAEREKFPKTATCVPSLRGQGGSFCGRKGMPADWIATMYADYLRLGSLEKAGALHGRTRQSMFEIFKRRGLKLRSRNLKPQVTYRGRKYTLDEQNYYRDTIYRSSKYTEETFLHRRVWTDHRGPIPPGNTICFKDGNRANWKIGNLEMLTHDEQQQRRGTGANGATTTAGVRMNLLMHKFATGGRMAIKLK